jgi:ribonuclease J
MKDGTSPSEDEVASTLSCVIASSTHRVAVTTFASNVGRVISMARAAQKAGRKVVMSGRALHRISGIARELGMLEGIDPFLDQNEYKALPRAKVVLLCTGSQGEARAAIARIAREDHPRSRSQCRRSGDLLVLGHPGQRARSHRHPEHADRRGIESDHADAWPGARTTGHPRREELLKRLYDLIKPDVLVPVHGEAAHLEAHALLGPPAWDRDRCLQARNGDMVRLFPEHHAVPRRGACRPALSRWQSCCARRRRAA